MALRIPNDFDFQEEHLDVNERIVRDNLRLNIENWARFRYTIHTGTNSNYLQSAQGSINQQVKEAYIELGKSHYEVITSLGCIRLAFNSACNSLRSNLLMFKKSIKDFYFHAGCLLDNIARIIYIINDPNSVHCTTRRNRQTIYMRHWVDWGCLLNYPGYTRIKRSIHIREICNVRNNLTHSWAPPYLFFTNTIHPS